MAPQFTYRLEFAGVPFLTDDSFAVRQPVPNSPGFTPDNTRWPRKHQPLADLIDEINRLIPLRQMHDFRSQSPYPGRAQGALAMHDETGPQPSSEVQVGEWFYPNGACRWSVFRGLMTSTMVKDILAATGGFDPKTFRVQAQSVGPDNLPARAFLIETPMYLLPPRPLAEHGGNFDGLYLITLVDARYYWQGSPASLTVNQESTWAGLIATLAGYLNATITHSDIDPVYGRPEADSQLWSRAESAPNLLDAVALSLGRVVVREFGGSYVLLTPSESKARVDANRGAADKAVRIAGGDIFYSGRHLPCGNLTPARNAALPAEVKVQFPPYVIGDDPVPHYLNSRYANQRPGCWFEDGYGGNYEVSVPVRSGGPELSGLFGVSTTTVHSTAKALLSGEVQVTPLNVSGLNALAAKIASDYLLGQVYASLDEVYPGTYAWQPEGLHDIIWTYSCRRRLASTRVVRPEWNQSVREMQHGTPALSGFTDTPRGVGGPSVAQTVRDAITAGGSVVTGSGTIGSGDLAVSLGAAGNAFPQANRWRGQINGEVILFEGLSGGNVASVVYRGIDGTLIAEHASGSSVAQVVPNAAYGVNLITFGHGLAAYPGAWTSGGISEVRVELLSGATSGGGGSFAPPSGAGTTVSGWPYPMPSGVYQTISGYPFPVYSGVYNVVSGYPFPVTSGTRVVVSGCFPFPLCSGPYSMVNAPPGFTSGPQYPFPVWVPPGVPTTSAPYTTIPVTTTSAPVWPFPIWVPPDVPLTSAPYGMIQPPTTSSPIYPFPVWIPPGYSTTNPPYSIINNPNPAGAFFPFPVMVGSGVDEDTYLFYSSGYPYPIKSGVYNQPAGYPVPILSGGMDHFGIGSGAITSGKVASGVLTRFAFASGEVVQNSLAFYSGLINSGLDVFTLTNSGGIHGSVGVRRGGGADVVNVFLEAVDMFGDLGQTSTATLSNSGDKISYDFAGAVSEFCVPPLRQVTLKINAGSGEYNAYLNTAG